MNTIRHWQSRFADNMKHFPGVNQPTSISSKSLRFAALSLPQVTVSACFEEFDLAPSLSLPLSLPLQLLL